MNRRALLSSLGCLACAGCLGGDPVPHAQGTRSVTLVGLGGGTYAFAVDGWFATEDYEDGVGFAARFELDGPAVELAPTNAVRETTREGDTVVVETAVESGEDTKLAAFEVTHADDGSGDARRLVTEQALRDRTLRNTLPFFEEGVRTVRLVERTSTVPPFGVRGTEFVEYEGERYRITASVVESSETATGSEAATETAETRTSQTTESGE